MNSNIQNNPKINVSLNVVKCIAILAVICIHCGVYYEGTVGELIVSVSKFAVPFFFLISGFYSFYESGEYSKYKYKIRIIRLLKLIILSNALFFIYNLLARGIKIIPPLNLNSFIKYVIFDVSPFEVHLWFLQALLYCYIVYYVLINTNFNLRKLYYLIPPLLIGNLILGEAFGILGISIDIFFYRNFIFLGLPFFILGYFIQDKQEEICRIFGNRMLLLIIFLSLVFSMAEYWVTGGVLSDLYVGTIILSTSIFVYCVKNPQKLNFKLAAWIGGTLYTSMYILHFLVFNILKQYLHFGYLNPLILFAVTCLIVSISYLK